jgi:hypothetical protein
MIGVSLYGRLGNQLFQYAFAYSTSKKLKTNFYIDLSSQKFTINEYFLLTSSLTTFLDKHFFSVKGYKNIFSHYFRTSYSKAVRSFFNNERTYPFDVTPNDVLCRLEDKTMYHGYFQSEAFFSEYKTDIKNLFRIKNQIKKGYHLKFNPIFQDKKIIAVHLRRTDYHNLSIPNLGSSDLTIPSRYYHNLIASLNNENTIFVFISDEPKFIESEFDYIKNKIISHDNEITDFQHMLNADICIISNSTFSWWAAYLNEKQKKIVYCPKYFLGFHINKTVPPYIYPDDWIQIDVNHV